VLFAWRDLASINKSRAVISKASVVPVGERFVAEPTGSLETHRWLRKQKPPLKK
jgi:hypothetical protein